MRHQHERGGLVLLLMPYLVGIALLVAIPALATIYLALHEYGVSGFPEFRGFGNFEELFADPAFTSAAWSSLAFIAVAVPLRFAAALGLALLLHRPMRGARAERAAIALPTVVPDVAFALVWLWILNPLYGPLNLVLRAIGIGAPDWTGNADAARIAILAMSVFTIGEGFVIALASRQQLPGELHELAALEGSGRLHRLRRLVLPLMAPTLLLLVFRDIVFSLHWTFVPTLLITGGGPEPDATTFLPLFVYRVAFDEQRYGYASAASVVMFAVTLVIVAIQYAIVRRWRRALAT